MTSQPRPLIQAFRPALRMLRRARLIWIAFDRVILLVLVMKALILFDLGEEAYRTRLAAYKDPTPTQRIGLLVMTLDPVTLKLRDIATQLHRLKIPTRRMARR